MAKENEDVEYVVLNWPGVAYKIASGVGLLLVVVTVFVMFNWRDLVKTYRNEKPPVKCLAVPTK